MAYPRDLVSALTGQIADQDSLYHRNIYVENFNMPINPGWLAQLSLYCWDRFDATPFH